MVVAPNAALCRQVVAAADSLKGPGGRPLAATLHLSTASPPRPGDGIDIAVVTPGALHTPAHHPPAASNHLLCSATLRPAALAAHQSV